MDTYLFLFSHLRPPLLQINYNWIHVIRLFCNPTFTHNIILHTSPNDATYFWMNNRHPKLLIHQLLLLFNIALPPQCMKPTLALMIILKNILPISS